MVGGFLVALAAVGTFAAYTGATADDRHGYVVAAEDLRPGTRLREGDLALVPLELSPALQQRAYRRPSDLVGAVLTGPLRRDELVQTSDVLRREGAPVGREISFAIESARAVDGTLQDGELVDVIATYGTGADSRTLVVLRGARVVHRRPAQGALADGRTEVITLAVPEPNDGVAVAHAVTAGTVTLVRAPQSSERTS